MDAWLYLKREKRKRGTRRGAKGKTMTRQRKWEKEDTKRGGKGNCKQEERNMGKRRDEEG